MILPDVNVLVYAHRRDAEGHAEYRRWLEEALAGPAPVGLSDLVLSGFLRIVTHPRIFADPTPLSNALDFVRAMRKPDHWVSVKPGPRHWSLFLELVEEAGARGNLIPDAWFAALAIESGSEWITTDEDYQRFSGLKVRRPLP